MPTAKILDQRHPSFDAERLAVFDALYEGGTRFEELRDTLLPKAPLEGADRYQDRMTFATYTNHAAPLVDMIGAWLFTRTPVVAGLDSAAGRAWLDDVDGQGSDWAAWWREPFGRAVRDRTAYIWVNLPRRPEGLEVKSRLDEELAGLTTPFLVGLDADTVINWTEDERGNLAAIMVRVELTRQVELLKAAERLIQWTLIDATTITRWEYVRPASGEAPNELAEIPQVASIAHGLGRIPVIRLRLSHGLHAMGKMRDPAVALLRTEHDHDWALVVSAHPILTVTTPEGGLQSGKAVVATGAYIGLSRDSNGADEVAYVEPPGASYEARRSWIDYRLDALHRVVQQMAVAMSSDGTAKGGRSGASKEADWKSLAVMLGAYAAVLRAAMEEVLDLVCGPALLGVDASGVSVGGLAGWDEGDIADTVATFAAAFPEIKSPTFRKLAAKGMARRLLPDVTEAEMKTINEEIDAADYEDAPVLVMPGVGGDPEDPAVG